MYVFRFMLAGYAAVTAKIIAQISSLYILSIRRVKRELKNKIYKFLNATHK